MANPTTDFDLPKRRKTMINQVSIELPSNISSDEAKLFLATKLYEVGKLSLGKAAQLSGYSKSAFIEILSQMGIPVIDYSPDDLERELSL